MQYNIGAFLFPFKPVWNVFCMWNDVLIPFACHRKAVQYQSWPPSAAQTQPSPWSCSALWVKRSPTGTSLFPRWVSARPLLWYTWVLKETLLHRWHRSAHGLFITCTSSITWCLYVTYSTHIKSVHNKNVVTLACIHKRLYESWGSGYIASGVSSDGECLVPPVLCTLYFSIMASETGIALCPRKQVVVQSRRSTFQFMKLAFLSKGCIKSSELSSSFYFDWRLLCWQL